MSFSRLIYDQVAERNRLHRSTAPLNYQMYRGQFEVSGACRGGLGTLGGNQVVLPRDAIDVESELRGQTRQLSRFPAPLEALRQPASDLTTCQLFDLPQFEGGLRSRAPQVPPQPDQHVVPGFDPYDNRAQF